MAGERRFTRIPPESSGDRIKMKHTVVIPFDQKVLSHNWIIGGLYTIDGNFGDTFTIEVLGYDQGGDLYQGVLYARYDDINEYTNNEAEDDQNIKDPDGNVVAFVNGTPYAVYNNTTQIVGNNNPEYSVDVDRFGSLNTRFAEGAPELSSFGKLRVSNPKLLAEYSFDSTSHRDQFVTSTEGSGETVWQPQYSHIELSSVLDGDRATYTSNLFHPNAPGAGTFFVLGTRLGSSGTTSDGTIRFWGAFDAENGAFFSHVQGVLGVRHRWTIDGTTTEMNIAQSDWNKDTLDGSGGTKNPSGMNIDVTKQNMYWVDFQNTGGGRIRWGVFYLGERVACHEMYMSNGGMSMNQLYNAFGNPNRPVCWAVAKRSSLPGAAITNTEEYLYGMGAGVYLESDTDILEEGFYRQYNDEHAIDASNTSSTYFQLLAPARTNFNVDAAIAAGNASLTAENHTLYSPEKLEVKLTGKRLQITDAQVATNTLTITTSTPHYLTAGDTFDVYGTTNCDGRYKVTAVTDSDTFTVDSVTWITTSGAEQGELVGPKDNDTDDRVAEIELYVRSVVRGISYEPITFTQVEKDHYGDYLADGLPIAKFVVNSKETYDFNDKYNRIQQGTVRNNSDQSFARSSQSLTSLLGDTDDYSTGVNRVKATIGVSPLLGVVQHFFDDKGKVITRLTNRDGTKAKIFDNSNYSTIKNTEGDWMYLSLLSATEAWLYNSEADIDDDRSVRVLQLDADPTGNIAVGNSISIGSNTGPTATVKNIYQHNGGTWYLGVEARGNDNLGGTTWSTATDALTNQDIFITGGADTTINSVAITLSSDRIGGTGDFSGWTEDNERTTFDLDYKTSLLAIDSSLWSGVGGSSADIVTESSDATSYGISLYGPDPFQSAWAFKIRTLEKHKTDTIASLNMSWKERVQ